MDYRKMKSKVWCMKKALAASLAAVMAFSALPASRPVTVQAAKPYVSLRTAFKTLKVGQVNRMTLKNNTLGWKITKVATQDRTVAMVYGKTASSFMIKGKKAGRTTVRARLKTTARKKFTTKTVRCRIHVTAQEDALHPTEAVVSTQAELETALSSRNLKKLEIITDQSDKLTIPKGAYPDVELSVHAPAADIENNGSFKSITIQAIKPDTWIENAIGNVMRVVANAARIIVNQGARLERLNFAQADAKVSLEVNGAIDEISISAKMELSVSGKPEAPVKTVIEESAEGTVIESSAPLHITAHASADITLQEGAEDSKVEVESKDAKVELKNYTNATITIRKADGTIESKRSTKIILSRPSDGYGSSYTPPAVSNPTTPGAVVTTGDSLDTEDPGNSGGFGSIGDIVTIGQPPQMEDFIRIMNPSLTVTITRAAIEGTETVSASAVTMSAVLLMDIKPDQVQIDNLPYVMWTWKKSGNDAYEPYIDLAEDTFSMELDPLEPEDYKGLPDDEPTGLYFRMHFQYEYPDHAEVHAESMMLAFYDKPVLDQYIKVMEEHDLTSVTLKLPLTDGRKISGESVICYEFLEDSIISRQ